jgi:biopolymer transport protein ExbB
MKHIILSVLFIFGLAAQAQEVSKAKNLDELLMEVKGERSVQAKMLAKREAEFKGARSKQKRLLSNAKSELRKLQAIQKKLTATFSTNNIKIGKIETRLNEAKGSLGEMFGVVKQVAGDFKGQFQNSVISAQITGRDKFMSGIAERKELPTITELESLWFEVQREMTESGKVTKFKSQVVLPDGSKTEREITRIGTFNIVSDGKYLSYQHETNQITELPRQPQGKYLSWAGNFEEENNTIEPFGLDPSRGAILGMLVQAPSLGERIAQGGVVGYVILCVLFVGLVMVAERLFTLSKEGKKIKEQLSTGNASDDNALGRLMKIYESFKNQDLETLEMKMEESILKSLPQLEKGISTIKIFFSVAPLLGLLGTVTGMIATFQSITLFGTGDPKLMAGGISSALVTTVLGLVCAIPLLLLHNFVSSKSKGLIQILEEQSAGMMALKSEKA